MTIQDHTYQSCAIHPWPNSVVEDVVMADIIESILLDTRIGIWQNPAGHIHVCISTSSRHAKHSDITVSGVA
jgi:hypothetical protein